MKKIKNILNWNIKDKVKLIVSTIEKNDNTNGYSYFNDLIPFYFSNDNDLPLIQEKMNNIMNILNDTNGITKLQDMDFENEIWDLI